MESLSREELVHVLQNALRAEISAVTMYTVHSDAVQESDIAQAIRAIGDVEMGHAKALTERLRALGETPAAYDEQTAAITRSLSGAQAGTLDMLRLELEEEQNAIVHYAKAIARIMDDEATLDVLEENLLDEMRHARWLKSQISKLERHSQS
ncbi:MAG: ferritin-like domain-containing protein [Anaerolineae bacterium]|nr:MAG: ferritin-like domain-containing protein [Anaerolineae bacterium]